MNLVVEATYVNGVLKPDQKLPLQNGERVQITLATRGRAKESAGIFAWKGDAKDLESLLGPDNHTWVADE